MGLDDDAILAISDRKNNAELIADVARLGYIEGSVLDVTYGKGAFWTEFVPADFTCHDLKLDGVDFRDLPYDARAFDTVVFDPPYKLNGRPDPALDERYGVDVYASIDARLELMIEGVVECARVSNKWLLVKCQDQVASGRVWWQTDLMTNAVTMNRKQWRKVDVILFPSYRKQPAGRRQVHARRNYSTLLVFRRES